MYSNSYAQTLRLIGQDLEELLIEKFELEVDKSVFIVRGEIVVSESEPKSAEPQPKAGFFPGLWKRKTISPEPRVQVQAIERRYTAADLERLAREGRSHSPSDEKPDFYKPGEFLRVIGAYLDKKRGRLLKLCKDDQQVTLHYETMHGEKKPNPNACPLSTTCTFTCVSRDMAQRERQFLPLLKTTLIAGDPLNCSDIIPNEL